MIELVLFALDFSLSLSQKKSIKLVTNHMLGMTRFFLIFTKNGDLSSATDVRTLSKTGFGFWFISIFRFGSWIDFGFLDLIRTQIQIPFFWTRMSALTYKDRKKLLLRKKHFMNQ